MSKYQALTGYLEKCKTKNVELNFSDITEIIKEDLPLTAYNTRNWWANDTTDKSRQCKYWLDAGYKVTDIDLVNYTVVFTKFALANYTNYTKISVCNKTKKHSVAKVGEPFNLYGNIFVPINDKYINNIKQDKSINGTDNKGQYNKFIRNKIGSGIDVEFCTFDNVNMPKEPGVYIFVIDKEIKYIGRAVNLKNRFSNNGYRKIYDENCKVHGQSTNCKVNWNIYNQHKEGNKIYLYYCVDYDYKGVEKDLLDKINTDWNIQNQSQIKNKNKKNTKK